MLDEALSRGVPGVDVEIVPGVRVEGGLEELLDLEEGVVRRLEAEGERDLGKRGGRITCKARIAFPSKFIFCRRNILYKILKL